MKTRRIQKAVKMLIRCGVVVAVVSMLLLALGFPYWTADTTTITITDKERIVERSGESVSSKYLVFTETETFENTDCFVRFKFNSSDIQGRLKAGKTYTVDVYGWRIPFLSLYRNIVRVHE